MSKLESALKEMMTPGTRQCSLLCALLGALVAVLLLFIGFWKTVFILLCAGVGALLGGVGNKKETVRGVINRFFPSKDEPLKESVRVPLENRIYKENKPDDQA